jgi:hypothetical protein
MFPRPSGPDRAGFSSDWNLTAYSPRDCGFLVVVALVARQERHNEQENRERRSKKEKTQATQVTATAACAGPACGGVGA